MSWYPECATNTNGTNKTINKTLAAWGIITCPCSFLLVVISLRAAAITTNAPGKPAIIDTTFLNLVRGERDHENYGISHTIRHWFVDEAERDLLMSCYKFECRSCGNVKLKRVVSLGYQPLANNLLKKRNEKPELYPLEMNYCPTCHNCQLSISVEAKKMFSNYLYTSSTSKSFKEHFVNATKKYVKEFKLKPKKSYIIDIGSNDGVGLLPFKNLGFTKVSEVKLAVSKKIRDFVIGGGFMFAMCSATDSFDIALSADDVDIAESMFDGDPSESDYQSKINFNKTFAFKDFNLIRNPTTYEFSSIDMTTKRFIPKTSDYFSLIEFSAKWDQVPTMLTQNHTQLVKGFMGQTTSFDRSTIKSNILVLGENRTNREAKYIHGTRGKGMFTFYGGHDPEDYTHRVGDPKTELELHKTSPGYRLILNNVLFPAAKKKKEKT